ncbi:FAD:protein FMN transferase [Terrabacter terrigena]|uniref:FAD:protein FMN transferase n=1 Tax=Terrabacter terrigena TaxID=574718 RepID=A0ABW3MW34_9MICO
MVSSPSDLPQLADVLPPIAPPLAEVGFRAMGSDFHVVVAGGDADTLLGHARERVEALEQAWSRFRPDSDLSRLNAAEGAWTAVEPETASLLGIAVHAYDVTGGLFDPRVHDDLVHAGYDRSFELLGTGPHEAVPQVAVGQHDTEADAHSRATREPLDVEVDDGAVRLPAGCRIDLGGIGKGRTADLLAAELVGLGADGACVNAGGDVRARGWSSDGLWAVEVEDPFAPEGPGSVVGVVDGAVATSSVLKRSWADATGRRAHHLIDPRTGAPADTGVASVTVVASQTLWAEVFAKAVVVAGADEGLALLARHALDARITLSSGEVLTTHDYERFSPWTTSSGGTSPVRAG